MPSGTVRHSLRVGMSITGYTAAKIRSQMDMHILRDSSDTCTSNRISEKNLDPIGDTDLRYAQILDTLVADGFNGAASIEHWGQPEDMLDGIRQLRAVIDAM